MYGVSGVVPFSIERTSITKCFALYGEVETSLHAHKSLCLYYACHAVSERFEYLQVFFVSNTGNTLIKILTSGEVIFSSFWT